jgi:Uma2 family endonuclease
MGEPVRRKATYEDLYSLPENVVGEIIDGEILVTPRPARRHVHAASSLGGEVLPPYHFGRGGGPGGWIIYDEPELELGQHILVPDLAGWRKERLVTPPEEVRIGVTPDWVCEVLSPSTVRVDKVRKMPIYAQYGVPYLWLIDPAAKTLDVFALTDGKWVLLVAFAEDDKVRAEPFQEIEIELKNLWLE